MPKTIKFRVAEGIAAWSASDYDETFEAGAEHEVPVSEKGLAQTVRDAADAGSLVIIEEG